MEGDVPDDIDVLLDIENEIQWEETRKEEEQSVSPQRKIPRKSEERITESPVERDPDVERGRMWYARPPGEHVILTSRRGVRVYISYNSQPVTHELPSLKDSSASKRIAELLDKVDARRINRLSRLDDGQPQNSSSHKEQLWVDVHAPHVFTDLLSDDRTNRMVMRWLTQWCSGPAAPQRRRAVLLSGPPGLGKTTLAHIAVKHAGFRAVEINASDDRSRAVLVRRFRDISEMQGGIFPGRVRRPCIILDEVDGAGEIAVVAEMLGRGDIHCPVICTCNNPYAPAIRQLRVISDVFFFNTPPPNRICSRLKEILHCEERMCDTQLLHTLCSMTGGDIRSCLNTLQFMLSPGKSDQDDESSQSSLMQMMQKDINAEWFSIYENLFRIKRIGRTTNSRLMLEALNRLRGQRLSRVIDSAFIMYPRSRASTDAHGNRLVVCASSLSEYDVLSTRIQHTQAFEISGQLIFPLLRIFRTASSISPGTRFPFSELRNQRDVKESRLAVLRSVVGLSGVLSWGEREAASDVVSYLVRLLAPSSLSQMRIVREDSDVWKTALHLHREYHIRYSDKYEMDPPLYSLCTFDSIGPSQISPALRKSLMQKSQAPKSFSKKDAEYENHEKGVPRVSYQPFARNKVNTGDKSSNEVIIRYRFHAGHTDAVRRPAKMREFL